MADERRDLDKRPSPEALLKAARREDVRAGRLMIFVGAAPGVGKTYTMLETARARKKDGYDVVIGVVETHGRRETAALARGLEVVPRRTEEYKGRVVEEMDLDAIIARRPQIVLVDELAHTNAPGSRHPKRYLDVEELLGHGIDVYTTVNIQHIESLNDVVAQITRIRVRETVPDSIFDRADAVELVDLTPADLIQRLKDGKVYIPKQAERALNHFFSPANLTALRELAMRRTAARVEEQLLTEMQARAIPGPWAVGERILVCVNEETVAAGLVRYAKRTADRLRAPWTALSIETRRSLRLGEEARDRVADALRLAERLGGEALTIPGGSRHIADDIIAFARAHNITQIIVGKSERSRWFEILYGSVVHELLRRSGNIGVQVVGGEELTKEALPKKTVRTAQEESRFDPIPYVAAVAAVGTSLGVASALRPWLGIESVDLVFLTAVMGIAVRFGLLPSLFASVAASLCYNFFFLPPIYTFTITDPINVAAFVSFIIVAVIVSNIAARVRTQAAIATIRASTTEALYAFSRKLAGTGELDDVLWAAAYQIASMLHVSVVLLLPEKDEIVVRAGYPPEDTLGQSDLAAATWAWRNERPAGRGADTLPGAQRLFLPLRTGEGVVGIVGIDGDKAGPLLTPDQRRLLDALSDQTALAIERVRLVEDIDRTRRAAETERLRAALLTSLSHDLKTPLAAIIGAAGMLRELPDKLSPQERGELVTTIIEESERLNRFIANLLDMTKLEAGAVSPNTSAYSVGEIVAATLKRASKILAAHRVEVDPGSGNPMVTADDVLLEQVLFNLLDNAAKYAPPGSPIKIRVWEERHRVCLQVLDEGPGIPPGDLERIFDKFYRVHKGDQVRAGTGLGLAISRGFADIMHGTITAANRTDRSGAAFTLALPVAAATTTIEPAA